MNLRFIVYLLAALPVVQALAPWKACAASTDPFAASAGSYQGLFYESTQVLHASSGSLVATLSSKGSLSGSLQLAGKSLSFSGKLSAGGEFSTTLSRGALPPVSIQLRFESTAVGSLAGTINSAAWTANLIAFKGVYDARKAPCPLAGRFTLVLPGASDAALQPAGHGYGTVAVSTAGRVTLTGVMGDGTKMSQSALVSAEGAWPVYVPLYTGAGSTLGWLGFANRAGSDLDGTLNWVRPPQAKSKFYPARFAPQIAGTGSRFTPTNNVPILGIRTGEVALVNGNLAKGIYNNITIAPNNNKVRNLSSNALTLTFSKSAGSFSGSVMNPATRKSISISGVVHQKQNSAFGVFLGTNQTGAVSIDSGKNLSPIVLDQSLPEGALLLEGASPNAFNSLNPNLSFSLTGVRFDPDPNRIQLQLNGRTLATNEFTLGAHTLSLKPALGVGRNTLSLVASDLAGRPLFYSTSLWAGAYSLAVTLLNEKGALFKEPATITVSLADDPTVTFSATATTGKLKVDNVPGSTILLKAMGKNNRIGMIGLAGNEGVATITLLGFDAPSSVDNNDFSSGSAGWDVGSAPVSVGAHEGLMPSAKPALEHLLKALSSRERPSHPLADSFFSSASPQLGPSKRTLDQDLTLSTAGEGEQSISRTFRTQVGTSTVRVRYRFITEEVPGEGIRVRSCH